MPSAIVVVPRGLKGHPPITMDLEEVLRAEGRIVEVALVTPMKAPELLATFNIAFLNCSKFIALLEAEHVLARREADKVRSVVILDRVPRVLAERNLTTAKNPAGSEDLRRAVLDGDAEYGEAMNRVDEISRWLDLMKGKQKGIEMAYTSVKKILGENAFNFAARINGGSEGNSTAGQVAGIGKARL